MPFLLCLCVWFCLLVFYCIPNKIKAKSIFLILMEGEMLHLFRCFKVLHSVYLHLQLSYYFHPSLPLQAQSLARSSIGLIYFKVLKSQLKSQMLKCSDFGV